MTVFGNHTINGYSLDARDAAGISETDKFSVTANEDSGLLFIEVPFN